MGKRRSAPNYYQRRDAKARRDAARRAQARSPEAIADRLLESIDVDGLAQRLARNLEGVAERMEQRLENNREPREGQSGHEQPQ